MRPGGYVRLCFCSRAAPVWRNRLQLGQLWPAAGAPRLSVSPLLPCALNLSVTRPTSVSLPLPLPTVLQTRSNTKTTKCGQFDKTSAAQVSYNYPTCTRMKQDYKNMMNCYVYEADY